MGLTPMQAALLEAIRINSADGVGPSYDELRQDLGLASKAGVVRLLRGLRERGYVRWLPRRARSIEIISEAERIREFSDAALLAEVKRRGL